MSTTIMLQSGRKAGKTREFILRYGSGDPCTAPARPWGGKYTKRATFAICYGSGFKRLVQKGSGLSRRRARVLYKKLMGSMSNTMVSKHQEIG